MTEFRLAQTIEYRGYIVNEVFAPLPPGSHGSVVWNEDDSFTAFIDPNDSYDAQKDGILHELDEHINGRHFDNIQDKDANKLEMVAHHIISKPMVETRQSRWKPTPLKITLKNVCWVLDLDYKDVVAGRIECPDKPSRKKFDKMLKDKIARTSPAEVFDIYFEQAYADHERRLMDR